MIDIFNDKKIDLYNLTCHSGGAPGSDTAFESISNEYGVAVKAYSYKTNSHSSPNKVEISEDDYQEGIVEINKANHWLNRYGIHKYMNLLARNWCQIKYSNQVIAIGKILNPGEKGLKGYRCNSKYQSVDGGTGYAVMCAINNNRTVFVYDQYKKNWFRWSYTSMSFIQCECPEIVTQDFAGIGTREINADGLEAIRNVFSKTFKQRDKIEYIESKK
jgi:hypothetical protein